MLTNPKFLLIAGVAAAAIKSLLLLFLPSSLQVSSSTLSSEGFMILPANCLEQPLASRRRAFIAPSPLGTAVHLQQARMISAP